MSEARRLKELEDEKRRLKHMVADLSLDEEALKAVIRKTSGAFHEKAHNVTRNWTEKYDRNGAQSRRGHVRRRAEANPYRRTPFFDPELGRRAVPAVNTDPAGRLRVGFRFFFI